MIERRDILRHDRAEFRLRQIRKPDVVQCQIRTVELQDETRLHNRLIFAPHHGCQRLEVRFPGGVEVIWEEVRERPRRDRREKHVHHVCSRGRLFEVPQVRLDRREVCPDDRGRAREAQDARARPAGCPAWELSGVNADRQRLTPFRKPADPLADVVGEADLAHFTVIDDVQSHPNLLANALGDRLPDQRLQATLLDDLAAVPSK